MAEQTQEWTGCVHCGSELPHEGTEWRKAYRCRLFQGIAEKAWDEGFNCDYEGDGWPPNPYRLNLPRTQCKSHLEVDHAGYPCMFAEGHDGPHSFDIKDD